MYQDQGPITTSTTTSTTIETPQNDWDGLSSGEKTAIISVLAAFAIIFLAVFFKMFGEWIGYRWATRDDKNVVSLAVMQHRDSTIEENYHDRDEFRETNFTPSSFNVNEALSGLEISAIDRIIARESSQARRYANTGQLRPNPVSFPAVPRLVGPDLPPAYDEALNLAEPLGVDNQNRREDCVVEPDCPPPSYWNSTGTSVMNTQERTGYR